MILPRATRVTTTTTAATTSVAAATSVAFASESLATAANELKSCVLMKCPILQRV